MTGAGGGSIPPRPGTDLESSIGSNGEGDGPGTRSWTLAPFFQMRDGSIPKEDEARRRRTSSEEAGKQRAD
jgi:hypothetical protein